MLIKIYKKYKVNFLWGFSVRRLDQVSPNVFIRIFLGLMLIILSTFLVESMSIKGYFTNDTEVNINHWPTLALFCGLFMTFLQQFDVFEREFRRELIYTTFQTMIAPFGRVSLRETFLGDILTSVVKPLIDFAYVVMFFSYKSIDKDGNVRDPMWYSEEGSKSDIMPGWTCVLILSLLPLNFRFWACIHKVYHGHVYPSIFNAGKYFFGMVAVVIAALFTKGMVSLEVVYAAKIFSTCYSYFWDIKFDWGLLRFEGGHCLLRRHISYPAWVYYICAVINLVLRFAWLLPTFVANESLPQSMQDTEIILFTLTVLEAYRRAQWALFRVEVEILDHYQKYANDVQRPFQDAVDKLEPCFDSTLRAELRSFKYSRRQRLQRNAKVMN